MSIRYQDGIKTQYNINSIKCNTKEYIFFTQKNNIQLMNPEINTTSQYTGHNSVIQSIDLLDSQLIGCSSFITVHDILRDSPVRRIYKQDPFSINQCLFMNSDLITTCCDNGTINFYDLRQHNAYKPIQTYSEPKDSVNCMTYNKVSSSSSSSSSCYKLHCGSNDGKLYTYDLRGGLVYIDDFCKPITSVSTSADTSNENAMLLINCIDDDATLFNFSTKQRTRFIKPVKDKEYKCCNGIIPMGTGNNRPTQVTYLITSEVGDLYQYDHQGQLESTIKLQGQVLSSMCIEDGDIMIGSDYGIELLRLE